MSGILFNAGADPERDERARRAVKAFRAMQPTLTSYAKIMTKRSDVRVELATSSTPATDDKKIYYRPPIELGDNLQHDRPKCDKRDENLQQICPACAAREKVLINIYHEIGHIAKGTFQEPTAGEVAQALEAAIAESGSAYAEKVKARFDAAPSYVKRHLTGISGLVNEYLPFLLNALEDARVDREMYKARKGLKSMFDADVWRAFEKGVEHADGELHSWRDSPQNSQVMVGAYCLAAGYDVTGWFIPPVEEALRDEKLVDLLRKIETVRSISGSYQLAFSVLMRLRELGFCGTPNDPDPEPQRQDQGGDEPQENQEPEEGDDDGSQEADSGGTGQGSSDQSSEDSGDEQGEGSGDREPEEGEGSQRGDDGSRPDDHQEGPEEEEVDGTSEGSNDEADGSEVGDDSEAGSESGDESSDDASSEGDEGQQSDPTQDDSSESRSDDSTGEEGESDEADSDTGSGATQEGDGDEPSSGTEPEGGSDHDSGDMEGEGGGTSGSDEGAGEAGAEESEPDSGDESGDVRDSSDQAESSEGDNEGVPSEHDGMDAQPDGKPDSGAEGNTDRDERDVQGDLDEGETPEPDTSADAGEPVDLGADQGLGGVQIIEDEKYDHIPMGEPDDLKDLMHLVHPEPEHRPTTIEEEANEEAVDRAIIQGLYFETPSRNIYGVREHFYDAPVIESGVNMSRSWERYRDMPLSERVRRGMEVDLEPSESILGPALLRARIAFADNKRGEHLRHRKAGKVDSRVLGKRASLGDDRLFKKKILPGKKDYFVLIGMDVSGSTNGVNIALEKKAVMAQATLLDRMGIPFAIFAHTGDHHDPFSGRAYGLDLDIYHVKDVGDPWDSKVRSHLEDIGPSACNLDGHTLEFYRKQLDAHSASNKIILYYTDGKMPAENHDEELEILQREIRYCRAKNYTLLGIGIRTDSPVRHGLDTVQVDEDADLSKVIEHLEKRLV